MSIYYNMINERAHSTFGGNLDDLKSVDYDEVWVPHWFRAAKAVRDDFREQGLTTTATHIDHVILGNLRMVKASVRERIEQDVFS